VEDWFHWPSLGGSDADGKEALPITTRESSAGTELVEGACRKVNEFEYGVLVDDGRVQSGGVSDERHDGSVVVVVFGERSNRLGQKVLDAEQLCGEDAIKRGKAELALAMDEVGKMRGTEAGLTGEQHSGKLAAFDAASYFDAKPLVELRKIHCGILSLSYTPLLSSLLIAKRFGSVYQFSGCD